MFDPIYKAVSWCLTFNPTDKMVKICCLFLLAAAVVAGADRQDIDSQIDVAFNLANNLLRQQGITSGSLDYVKISPNVSLFNFITYDKQVPNLIYIK